MWLPGTDAIQRGQGGVALESVITEAAMELGKSLKVEAKALQAYTIVAKVRRRPVGFCVCLSILSVSVSLALWGWPFLWGHTARHLCVVCLSVCLCVFIGQRTG